MIKPQTMSEAFKRAGFEEICSNPSGKIFYADVIINGCTATIEFNSEQITPYIWIERLETLIDFRSQGSATQVLEDIFKLADKFNVTVRLEAVPTGQERMTMNQLVNWYSKRGFSVTKSLGNVSTDMARYPKILEKV